MVAQNGFSLGGSIPLLLISTCGECFSLPLVGEKINDGGNYYVNDYP